MTPMKYFIILNLFYVILSLLSILGFSRETAHNITSMNLFIGEPVIIYFMYKLKKDNNYKSIFV